MAKNDYYVIAYQILAYLYQRLKLGEVVKTEMLSYDSPLFKGINQTYWAYIMYHLARDGYIEGVTLVNIDGLQTPYPTGLDKCMITPAGIGYLTDNGFIRKAYKFLKDAKEIIPFELP